MREKKRVKERKELPGALYPQGRFSSGKQKTGKGRRMGEGGLDGLKPLVSYQRSNKRGGSQGGDHTYSV